MTDFVDGTTSEPAVDAASAGVAALAVAADDAEPVDAEAAARFEVCIAALVGETVDVTGDGGVLKKVLSRGGGPPPAPGSSAQLNYVGLHEGKEFDRNAGGYPFTFTIGAGRVIKGWEHAVATMRVGEKAVLTLTPEYAYGDAGSEDDIPPGATLTFKVELVGVGAPQLATAEELRLEEEIQRLADLREARAAKAKAKEDADTAAAAAAAALEGAAPAKPLTAAEKLKAKLAAKNSGGKKKKKKEDGKTAKDDKTSKDKASKSKDKDKDKKKSKKDKA